MGLPVRPIPSHHSLHRSLLIEYRAGFVGLGILSLVTSFVTSNKYGFLILRGLGGVAGSLTIPAS